MIKYYYKNLEGLELAELDSFKPKSWVYVEAPTDAEVATLIDTFKLEPGHLQDARDEDEMPRLEREGDQTYLFVRFAYKKSGGEIDTAPLLIILGSDFVVTISLVHIPSMSLFSNGRIQAATTQRVKLILLILLTISDQYDSYINQTSRKIKSIRSHLRAEGITNQDFIDFATIEDELNEFISSLVPTNATLRRLLTNRNMQLYEEDHDIVEDLLLNNDQSIEASRSNLQGIENIREAYSAINANNLNRTLTVLTIATLVISLPSFAMGVYSMNIRLPYQQTHWIFWVIMGFNVILMATVAIIARKKKII